MRKFQGTLKIVEKENNGGYSAESERNRELLFSGHTISVIQDK